MLHELVAERLQRGLQEHHRAVGVVTAAATAHFLGPATHS
jgi:hypothetical protein